MLFTLKFKNYIQFQIILFFKIILSTIFIAIGLNSCESDYERKIFVTTDSIVNSFNIITLYGTIIDIGHTNIIEHGHFWSETSDPINSGFKTQKGAGFSTGVFTSNIENLIDGSTYYYCAYAENNDDVFYGEVKSFIFNKLNPPVVKTGCATRGENNLYISGQLNSNINETDIYGFCWSPSNAIPTFNDSVIAINNITADNYFAAFFPIYNNEIIYYRAFAQNQIGTAYGEVIEINLNTFAQIQWVAVETAQFSMGSDTSSHSDQIPAHLVEIEAFAISKHEISTQIYCGFLNHSQIQNTVGINNPYSNIHKINDLYFPKENCENQPIIFVSWEGANLFATHFGYRLPTEAEWEFAARGGLFTINQPYSGSNIAVLCSWFTDNCTNIQNIALLNENELNLFDMGGNAAEWCADWYAENYYQNSPMQNPTGPLTGSAKVIRGGSFLSNENEIIVTYRDYNQPAGTNLPTGFRPVKNLSAK